jgi:iron complex transport system permease protein
MVRRPLSFKKFFGVLSLLMILLVIAFVLSLTTGVVNIGFRDALLSLFYSERHNGSTVILTLRISRFLIGAIAGWSLCLSGAVFQGILRNPLADSYVLGVASGAAFGAVLDRLTGIDTGVFGMPVFALLGSLLTIFIVYLIAKVDSKLNTGRMILAGVIIGTFFSACVSFILSVIPPGRLQGIMFWLLGDLSIQDFSISLSIVPYVILASALILLYSSRLNLLSLGEEGAEQLGVNVKATVTIFFFSASLITAAVVSQCGVIGFIGLIVPHMIRIILGPDHRLLLPASGLAGALLLVLSDLIARTVVSPAEIPIGVVTAFFGAPFFLYLLKWRR